MLLSRNGSVVTLTVGDVQMNVAPELYRDWSATLDEARRAHEAETRAAKIAADEAESLAKAQAVVAEVPGAWIVPDSRFNVKRYDAATLNDVGRIVVALPHVNRRVAATPTGARALGSAPSDIWFRVNRGTTLHRFSNTDWGSALSLCGRMYCDNDSARGYRGETKWKRCKKCEEAS